jgi:uncharacterized protein
MNGLIERLSDVQIRRPWLPILIVAAITAAFAVFASRLELKTRYDALLPQDVASVRELHRVEARTAGAQTVLILLEGHDRMALRAMGDALVPALLDLGPDTISSADDGTQAARSFLKPRAGLFLTLPELQRLRDDVFARWDYEVAKQADELLDDNGPPVTIDEIEQRFRKKTEDAGAGEDRPDGYSENKAGTALVVAARSPIPGGDLSKTGPALARVEATVKTLRASRPEFAAIRVGYAGDMPTGFAEYDRVRTDLLGVGAIGIVMILAAVLLYFMNFRALFVMGVTIGAGLVWTLGLTDLVIGHLNLATGFLISIIAGNGINVGILYQSRYFEERRKGQPVADALRITLRETWQPTIIAAVASAASYLSLLVTGFRAFRDFGFIAAVGMLFCWVVKTAVVPPLLLLLERGHPMYDSGRAARRPKLGRFAMGYGRGFAWLVPKAPRLFLAAGVAIVAMGVVAGVRYVRRDPMEYDLHETESDPSHNKELHRVWDRVLDILGAGHDGMVVLTDTPEDARALQKKLQADWDAARKNAKPFQAVHSLWDMVPEDQPAKIPLLLEIGERLNRARERGFLTDEEWNKVKDLVPPNDLQPFGLEDLPESIARPFSEKDGTRGRLVLVEPDPRRTNDLKYLVRYSNAFRETRLPSGKIVYGSGRAVIFADILSAVVRDIRRSVGLSLALAILAVVVTFRRGGWHALSVLFALLVGVSGELLFLYTGNVKLNFLNFAALPITFGIGVDYAINVVQRYLADRSRNILSVVRTTGGAVVLCSLTTILGYLALLGSHNRAIRSLGVIAVVGEVSCLLAAMIVLPALWLLNERRHRRPGPAAEPTRHTAAETT